MRVQYATMSSNPDQTISPSNSHSVVPIGGAPFVPPLRTMMQIDSNNGEYPRRSSMTASRYERRNRATHSPTSSPTMPTSPLSDSAYSSSSGSDASSSSSPTSINNNNWEAAMRYTSALHEHTRKMWEQERLSIERTKLGLPIENSSSSPTGTPTKSNTTNSLQKRSTLSGMDSLWRGRRKHSKNNSISEFRS
ncbi:uncharacterized protein FA14DRAFT_49841 [Meira miltonrushii]|uniref:Uncharacterized protein n=1 Tax=Meira miltonrushii TaxID=1280837 RepID=A0A316VIX1_9BASI|nr:uncharacterized protein FA14DRAFT_49841 [Meira miltonrushii]PWN35971.1 hypothetical protein FA14DRAFT_49841 [Meira miltonrushii]